MPRVRNITMPSGPEKYFSVEPRLLPALILLFLCMGLAACNDDTSSPESPAPESPAPESPVLEPPATATRETVAEPGFITSPVFVDEIEILLLESFPIEVYVMVRGNLATPCSEMTPSVQTIDPNNLIMLTLSSRQQSDSACVQMLKPFEKTFALDVLGLPAGTYQVSVNGIVDEFTLTVDN